MELKNDSITVRTTNEGVNNDTCPALVEIIDNKTGKVICKVRAVNKPRPGADGDTYPFIEFEEVTDEIDATKRPHQPTAEEYTRLHVDIALGSSHHHPGGMNFRERKGTFDR